jgi:glycerol-3-phosphate acyltransferase PlsY
MMGPLALLLAYLIGGIPFGYLLVRLKTGKDVRREGSGNIGATNVLRTQGKTLGVLTLLLDAFKGWFAVWLAVQLTGPNLIWASFAGLAVLVGHAFPVWLRFKGGKAVASAMGAFAYLAPLPLAAVVVVFVAVVASSRYISLGSIVAAAALPFGIWMILHPEWHLLAVAAAAAVLVIAKHHANIARLRAGTESVFRWKKV